MPLLSGTKEELEQLTVEIKKHGNFVRTSLKCESDVLLLSVEASEDKSTNALGQDISLNSHLFSS